MADSKVPPLTETSVPALDDLAYTVDVSDTTDDPTGSSRKLSFNRLLGLAGLTPGGRLTTESGVGVSTSDRTSQSTLYYTPYVSDYVRLSDGTRVREYAFTERSLALSGLTSGLNYDVFLYDNAGTLTLELTAWSNDTTRATALAWQTGLGWVRSGAATRLYLGTIRTTSTTTTEDSAARRYVWNAYNRVPRKLTRLESSGANWSYNTNSFRQANASSNNQVELVVGLAEAALHLHVGNFVTGTSTGGVNIALGEDSTTTPATGSVVPRGVVSSGQYFATSVFLNKTVPLGYHYYAWLERGPGSGTVTWGDSDTSGTRHGISGSVMA